MLKKFEQMDWNEDWEEDEPNSEDFIILISDDNEFNLIYFEDDKYYLVVSINNDGVFKKYIDKIITINTNILYLLDYTDLIYEYKNLNSSDIQNVISDSMIITNDFEIDAKYYQTYKFSYLKKLLGNISFKKK